MEGRDDVATAIITFVMLAPGDRSPWLHGRAVSVLGHGVRPQSPEHALLGGTGMDGSLVLATARQVVGRLGVSTTPGRTHGGEAVRAVQDMTESKLDS